MLCTTRRRWAYWATGWKNRWLRGRSSSPLSCTIRSGHWSSARAFRTSGRKASLTVRLFQHQQSPLLNSGCQFPQTLRCILCSSRNRSRKRWMNSPMRLHWHQLPPPPVAPHRNFFRAPRNILNHLSHPRSRRRRTGRSMKLSPSLAAHRHAFRVFKNIQSFSCHPWSRRRWARGPMGRLRHHFFSWPLVWNFACIPWHLKKFLWPVYRGEGSGRFYRSFVQWSCGCNEYSRSQGCRGGGTCGSRKWAVS